MARTIRQIRKVELHQHVDGSIPHRTIWRQTGAVARGAPHPIYTFLEHGIPVAVCTDNTTVSGTDQTRECRFLLDRLTVKGVEAIHRGAADQSFIRRAADLMERGRRAPAPRA
jgi:adenosine deaminase